MGLAHGRLDVQTSDVVPVLLQQTAQEVGRQSDVLPLFILRQAKVAHGHAHAQHLLELELDGGLGFIDLLLEVVGVREREIGNLFILLSDGPSSLGMFLTIVSEPSRMV